MKSPNAFRTISEVASELDVPQHVLRFWETRFNQVRPMKRGGGRRYYRPEDVALLKGIRTLLYGEGFTIKGVQKILRERGVQHVVSAYRETDEPPPDQASAKPAASADSGTRSRVSMARRADVQAGNDEGDPLPQIRGSIQSAIDELGTLKALLDRARN